MDENAQVDIELLRKKIGDLSSVLEKLGADKESAYKEKKAIDEKLSSLISSAKEFKAKKQQIDAQIKEKKKVRSEFNKEAKELSKQYLAVKKSGVSKRSGNPSEIKKQIEALQFAIETEGLTFEKEKAYMDRIKRLKAELAEIEKYAAKTGAVKGTLGAKKLEADTVHEEIQKLADESSKLFSILADRAKEITELKQKRSELQTVLKNLKTKIDATNQELASALGTWMEVAKNLPLPTTAQAAETAADDVLAKFKAGAKKLTKEDILKLQKLARQRK